MFIERLWRAIDAKGTPAMVGLDPRPDHFPEEFLVKGDAEACAKAAIAFHRELLELIAPKVAVVKPQAAFFEQWGPAGTKALADCCAVARELGLLVVMDAKRGDIGSTSEAYAEAFFSGNGFPPADALTINPYLGEDACRPFLDAAKKHDAGLFVLVKTSNPGAGFFQDHGSPPLAERVAEMVASWAEDWHGESGWSSVGAVVGATRPEELARFRELMPRSPILLPGFGFQGGTADGLQAAFDSNGHGAVVNSSRGILWAHERKDLSHLSGWKDRTQAAVNEMVKQLSALVPSPGFTRNS